MPQMGSSNTDFSLSFKVVLLKWCNLASCHHLFGEPFTHIYTIDNTTLFHNPICIHWHRDKNKLKCAASRYNYPV